MTTLSPAPRRLSICIVSYDDSFIERTTSVIDLRARVLSAVPQNSALSRLADGEIFDLVIVDIDEAGWEGLPNLQIVQVVKDLWRNVPVVAATYGMDADIVLKTVRAGASDICDKGEVETDLLPLLDRLFVRHSSSKAHERGQLLCIAGLLPGTGASTLAKGLAGEIGARLQKRVLVIDMNAKEVLPAELNTAQPFYGVLEAVKDISRIDDTLVESTFGRLDDKTTFYLPLVGAETGGDDGLTLTTLATLLSVLRGYFGWIILLPRYGTRVSTLTRLFAESDHGILCCDQRLTSIKACGAYLSSLDENVLASLPLRLAITRYDRRLVPDAAMIARKLQVKVPVIVPYDRLLVDMLSNAGGGFRKNAQRSALRRAFAELAGRLVAAERGLSSHAERKGINKGGLVPSMRRVLGRLQRGAL